MTDDREQFVAFRVGPFDLAVPIAQVKEVVRPLPVTTLPEGPDFLEGIVELRGAILPVVDLRKRFGQRDESREQPSSGSGDTVRFLVASVAGRIVALVADEVTEVIRVPPSAVKPAPLSKQDSSIEKVVRYRDKLYLVLDLDRLLTDEQLGDMARLAKALADSAESVETDGEKP